MNLLPSHLARFSEPIKPKKSYPEVPISAGRLKCTCGSTKLRLLASDVSRLDFEGTPIEIPQMKEFKGADFFVIGARCARCNKLFIIFDYGFHGYYAYIGIHPGKKHQKLARPPLRVWTCVKCGGDSHTAVYEAFYNGTKEHLEDAEAPTDKWQDAFDSFGMRIECLKCKKKTDPFVDFECR